MFLGTVCQSVLDFGGPEGCPFWASVIVFDGPGLVMPGISGCVTHIAPVTGNLIQVREVDKS